MTKVQRTNVFLICALLTCSLPDMVVASSAIEDVFFGDAVALIQSFLKNHKLQDAPDGHMTNQNMEEFRNPCSQKYYYPEVYSTDMIAMAGYMPQHVSCGTDDVEMLPELLQMGTALQSYGSIIPHIPPSTLVFAYLVFSMLLVLGIFQAAIRIYGTSKSEVSRYPEAEAWKANSFDWLWMGWATQWISRWGTAENSSLTKIDAKDIPLSDPDDEPPVNFERFQILWNEELERVGTQNASLLKVVTRFVTYRKVFAIGAWNGLYEGFMFMGPPMAIKWVTKYLNWIYTQRGLGTEITGASLVLPSMLLILIFTGLPLLMAVSDSMCTMLNGRISIRIDGALSLAVYDKAQRLPVVQEDDDSYNLQKLDKQRKRTIKSATDDENAGVSPATRRAKNAEETEFDNTEADPTEKLASNNYAPKRFNLVQVVTNDINTNIMAIPNEIARMVVMVPVLIGTMVMLVSEVGWAFIFSVAMAILNLGLMTSVGLLMRNGLGMFYACSGARLQFLQEVMAGIRFVKGSGAEKIVLDRMMMARKFELHSLETYYTIMCFMFILSLQFPKLYLLASLGGYAIFHHGTVEPTVIMSLIPLLFSVQGAICVVFNLVPNLIMALPSCRRLETFLKLQEAPRAVPSKERNSQKRKPDWVHLFPAEPELGTPKQAYRIQGEFAWLRLGEPTLTGLDVSIKQGQLVAVLGHVGSGKTTFLHAILGELYARGDSRIEVPERIAYSSQVPHLFEGTLKENILKDSEYNEKRYKQTLFAACLEPDLEILPGGDAAPVGGRGITLSGGQKARVSLARAAYDRTELVILDDPFAAVDAQTGRHIDEHYLRGPLLRNRTRVVCCQPDSDRMKRFDRVLVFSDGHLMVQGTPDEVMTSEYYAELLSSHQFNTGAGDEIDIDATKDIGHCGTVKKLESMEAIELREEECENRASWGTIAYFGRMGGWVGILTCIAFYLVKNVLDMRTQIQLSMWMSHGSSYEAGLTIHKPNPWHYILSYILWMCASTVAWFFCWIGGQSWTLNISEGCHTAMIKSLMHAPVDRFFDKTPTGRVMNRMANDMMNVDMQVFIGCCSTIGMIWSLSVPLYYVHLEMPLWFTVLSIPFYYLVITLIVLYWKTMVPLRYLMQVSKSSVSSEIADVESNPASVRAYCMQEERLAHFSLAVRKMISADFLGRIICIRWLCNRLFTLGACFVTSLALLCIWMPGHLDVGSASLLINTVFGLIVSIQGNLETGSMAQYQIIAMNRVYEYTSLPEEREDELPTDKTFRNFAASVPRSIFGLLSTNKTKDGTIQITSQKDKTDVILVQLRKEPVFIAGQGKTLADLAPRYEQLRGAENWHRITGINGAYTDIAEMAEELCNGDSEEVVLHIMSGWLADGVKIEIKNLRVGYGDIPKDVLSGVSITVPRRSKCGVVGPTGCGKSTLLLSMLRMLEPRDGRIYLEGVDTQQLGLRTLRNSMGLVPQDPVLLQGSLRFNIDPFELYDDKRIWEGLRLVHLEEYVKTHCKEGLDYHVTGEGANLSFGQRQLISLARNIVKRPMLLLLDEATSAIDPHTQELLQTTIEQAFPLSTMIVIAHRLETILKFDLAIVMFRGRVVEKGAIKELATIKGGRFAKMLTARGLSV